MNTQQFNIIFRGDIVFGCQLVDVKLKLQQLFKTDEAKINALFTGKPVVIKRNLDMVSAEKYRAALLAAGAQVEIVAVTEDQPATKESHQQHSTSAQPKPLFSPQSTANWGLAPVGSHLLNSSEQKQFVARDINTSSLQLCPVGANVLDASERQPLISANVVIPDLQLASVGSDLLQSDEKQTNLRVEINTDRLSVAEAGDDLIKDEEKDIPPLPIINTLDVGLAPVGSELGQIKSHTKPVAPDISGLHLVD